jgi:hypothetical protein
MPRTIGVLPPDDPIFSIGPSFVLYAAPPEAGDDPSEVDVTPEDDVEEEG